MYDFYFGTKEEILANERDYLLFIKRMLPRWVNGIPDSEFLAIHDILNQPDGKSHQRVLVETGSGASSLVMLYHAIKNNGTLYTWDTNANKGSFLREVASDTICRTFNTCVHDHWKFVAYSSTDRHLGINILREFNDRVDFCFLDSLHTLDNLLEELSLVLECFNAEGYIAIDDANYTNKSTNIPFINIVRKKLGLPAVPDLPNNVCRAYHIEVNEYLTNRCQSVERVNDTYKRTCTDDLSFAYYALDKQVTSKIGMEKLDDIKHRFDAWKITK